ncbi:hypothetical protein BDR26DRAFT_917375 [Obelidium mucronatum]|nr:hypothetical protein BDR26DRAFT_917375 [Obelidium mucronatum]
MNADNATQGTPGHNVVPNIKQGSAHPDGPPTGSALADMIRDFEQFETKHCKEYAPGLKCPKCRVQALTSEGVGGNLSQRGPRRVNVKCNACHRKTMYHLALDQNGRKAELDELDRLYKEIPIAEKKSRALVKLGQLQKGKVQQTLQFAPATKRARVDETPERDSNQQQADSAQQPAALMEVEEEEDGEFIDDTNTNNPTTSTKQSDSTTGRNYSTRNDYVHPDEAEALAAAVEKSKLDYLMRNSTRENAGGPSRVPFESPVLSERAAGKKRAEDLPAAEIDRNENGPTQSEALARAEARADRAEARADRAEAKIDELMRELKELKDVLKAHFNGAQTARNSNAAAAAAPPPPTAIPRTQVGGGAGRGRGDRVGGGRKNLENFPTKKYSAEEWERLTAGMFEVVDGTMVKMGTAEHKRLLERERATARDIKEKAAIMVEYRDHMHATGQWKTGANGRPVVGASINQQPARAKPQAASPTSQEEWQTVQRRKSGRLANEGGRQNGPDINNVGPPRGPISAPQSSSFNFTYPQSGSEQYSGDTDQDMHKLYGDKWKEMCADYNKTGTSSRDRIDWSDDVDDDVEYLYTKQTAHPDPRPSGPSSNWGGRAGGPIHYNGPPQGSISASHLKPKPTSYANAATVDPQVYRQQQQKLKAKRAQAAQRLMRPVSEPLQFKVIRMGINDNRPLRNVVGKERDKIVKELAATIGIGKFTVLTSTIGNSIIEFYVTAAAYDTAVKRIQDCGGNVLSNFSPFARPPHAQQSPEASKTSTVNRLSHLCLSARTVNLQDTIMEGAPDNIKSAVLEKVRQITGNPRRTIGRQAPHFVDDMETEGGTTLGDFLPQQPAQPAAAPPTTNETGDPVQC